MGELYIDRRPAGLQYPSCWTKQTICCDACGEDLAPRQQIAADFVIGGHATVDGDTLVSFGSAFYRKDRPSASGLGPEAVHESYFPSVTVYAEE